MRIWNPVKNYNLPIPRPPETTSKLQKKPSALKREHPALQNMKFFLLLWLIFVLLDPDPDTDPRPWLNPYQIQIRIRFQTLAFSILSCTTSENMTFQKTLMIPILVLYSTVVNEILMKDSSFFGRKAAWGPYLPLRRVEDHSGTLFCRVKRLF